MAASSLPRRLAAVLPRGIPFEIYHLSTPPIRTAPLFSAPPPPNDHPDRTFVENHFLGLAIDAPPQSPPPSPPAAAAAASTSAVSDQASTPKIFIFALEIFIFTTAFATTIFVSKADSTGYLHLLGLPARRGGDSSPSRAVTTTFLEYLIRRRRRPAIQTVISLFARSQDQYLFPGSVENGGKHVLDDRGLVRWWCRVLDPLVHPARTTGPDQGGEREGDADDGPPWARVRPYLKIPGLEQSEARRLVPRGRTDTDSHHNNDHHNNNHHNNNHHNNNHHNNNHYHHPGWTIDHPLELISHYTREHESIPARCLIPRFPDDPKSRYLDELDAEAAKIQATGQWKNIRTLEQFWEMMVFRQECSSGRMAGFIWLVFDPVGPDGGGGEGRAGPAMTEIASAPGGDHISTGAVMSPSTTPQKQQQRNRLATAAPTCSLRTLFPALSSELSPKKENEETADQEGVEEEKKKKSTKRTKNKARLTGRIRPRQPKIKTHQRNYLVDRPVSTAYYYWPEEGRGARIVGEDDYRRIIELLLQLDFSNLGLAVGSTARWVSEVGMGDRWGQPVVGTRVAEEVSKDANGVAGGGEGGIRVVNNLSGLVKRKRTDTVDGLDVMKKVRQNGGGGAEAAGTGTTSYGFPDRGCEGETRPIINVLGAECIKRRPKA